jgi:hypothetical protein
MRVLPPLVAPYLQAEPGGVVAWCCSTLTPSSCLAGCPCTVRMLYVSLDTQVCGRLVVCRLHKERRWQFELALACGQSDTDQLQQEEEEGGSDATREGRGSDDADEEDYEMVWGRDEAMEGLAGGGGGPPAPRGMPPPPPAPMAAAAPMMARDRASAAGPPGALGGLARMQVAQAQVRVSPTDTTGCRAG